MVEVSIRLAIQYSKFTELAKGNIYTQMLDSSPHDPCCASQYFHFFPILYYLVHSLDSGGSLI